jgi:hypothetical protein
MHHSHDPPMLDQVVPATVAKGQHHRRTTALDWSELC